VLGVDHRRGPPGGPRRDLPVGGLHAPRRHARAGQARLHAVVHLLHVEELARGPENEYFRPNFFPVTPDILHAYLQHGGPPAFVARLVLAATLSPSYGIYSGYESFENEPVREGSEEYLNSEKYEVRERRLVGPLLPMIRRINDIRQENPALQILSNVYWLETQNDGLIAYAKQVPGNCILVVVNIDPHNAQEGAVTIPAHLGLPPVFAVEDLLTGD